MKSAIKKIFYKKNRRRVFAYRTVGDEQKKKDTKVRMFVFFRQLTVVFFYDHYYRRRRRRWGARPRLVGVCIRNIMFFIYFYFFAAPKQRACTYDSCAL